MDYAKLLENAYKSNDKMLDKMSNYYHETYAMLGELSIIQSKLRAFFQPLQEEQATLYNEILDHFEEVIADTEKFLHNN